MNLFFNIDTHRADIQSNQTVPPANLPRQLSHGQRYLARVVPSVLDSKTTDSTWLERTGSLSNALGGSREHIKGIFILSSVCGNISNNFYFASKYSAKLLAICFAELLGLDSYIFPEPSCQIIIPSIPTFSTTYKLCLIFLFAAHSL